MKKNIDYYQHFSGSHLHPKFKMLRVKYGWEGEGKFWALNNMIAASDDCKLDLSKKFVLADIQDLFRMKLNEFEEFIKYLIDECELIDQEGNFITTDIVQENLTVAEAKREKERTRYQTSKIPEPEKNFLPTEEAILTTGETLSKVKKETKLSKGNGFTGENPFSFTDYEPQNYEDHNHVRNKTEKLFQDICSKELIKKEITTFTNIVVKNKHKCKPKGAFKILFTCCLEYPALEPHQKNLGYLNTRVNERIKEAVEKAYKNSDKSNNLPGYGIAQTAIKQAADSMKV